MIGVREGIPRRRTTAGTACIDRSIQRGIRKSAISAWEENGSMARSTSAVRENMSSGVRRTIGHYNKDGISLSQSIDDFTGRLGPR